MSTSGCRRSSVSPFLSSMLLAVAALLLLSVSPGLTQPAPPPSCYEAYELDDYARVVIECTPLAIRGDARAQLYLGIAHAYDDGVTADPMFGYMWLDIAVAHGMSGWSDAIRTRERVARELTDSELRIASFLAREYWSDVRRWLAAVTAHTEVGSPLMPGVQISWPGCEFTVNLLQEPRWTHEATPIGEVAVARAETEQTSFLTGCGPLSGELKRHCNAFARSTAGERVARRSALLAYLRDRLSDVFAAEITAARVSSSMLGVQTLFEGRKRISKLSLRFNARLVCGENSVVYVALLEPASIPPTPEGLIVLDSLARR